LAHEREQDASCVPIYTLRMLFPRIPDHVEDTKRVVRGEQSALPTEDALAGTADHCHLIVAIHAAKSLEHEDALVLVGCHKMGPYESWEGLHAQELDKGVRKGCQADGLGHFSAPHARAGNDERNMGFGLPNAIPVSNGSVTSEGLTVVSQEDEIAILQGAECLDQTSKLTEG
jgi:hypothetical protein